MELPCWRTSLVLLHIFTITCSCSVLFDKILFVFCSGSCKEFIVKELRPGTQYKFRLVLALLHIFLGGPRPNGRKGQ